MSDEKELIHRCLKGERMAQKQLYDKFAGRLYAVSFRYMKSKEDAGDVLQDSFIKIFNNLASFRYDCPLEAWLKRVVINTSLTALKNRKITVEIEDSYMVPDTENIGNHSLDYETLVSVVNSLPDGCRTVFNLYVVEGYKHSEIAEMLEISEGTSKSQLSRARLMLSEKIRTEDFIDNA